MKKFWDSACDIDPATKPGDSGQLYGYWCMGVTDDKQFDLCYATWRHTALSKELGESHVLTPEESFMLLCFMSYIYDGEL